MHDATQFNSTLKTYTDYTQLLSKEHIDAIVVACPPKTHVETATYAIERGIHVFVEKPPAETTPQLQAMVSLARRHKVKTGVGLNFRYAAPYQKMQSLMTKSSFGQPRFVDIKHLANKPTEPMWGLNSTIRSFLLAQAIHPLDLFLSYGNTVTAKHIDFIRAEKGFIVHITLSMDNDKVLGTITTGSLFPHFESHITVRSDLGNVATLDSLWNLHVSGPYLTTNLMDDPKRWSMDWHPSPLDSGHERSGYTGEIQAFVDAIAQDRIFEPSFESQLKVYELIDDIETEYKRKFGTFL